jgi:hypothetical protein
MFKVGQEVVCVNNTPKDNRPETIIALGLLKVGQTYTIREISDDGLAIILEEVISPYINRLGREMGYKADRFRPLDWNKWAGEVLEKIAEEIEEELLVESPKKN